MADKILKFSASWCGPCKSLAATIKGKDLGVEVVDIDIDEDTDTSVKYSIRSVPTMVYIRDGVELDRMLGGRTFSQVTEWISRVKDGVSE